MDERLAELDSWAERLADQTLSSELADRLLETLATDAEPLEESLISLRNQLAGAVRDLAHLDAEKRTSDEERVSLSRRLDRLDAQLREVDEERAWLYTQLAELSSSVTWRLRARLVGLPGLGAPLRWAARALARPAAPEEADSRSPAPTLERTAPAKESPAPDRPSDTPARRSGPSTR